MRDDILLKTQYQKLTSDSELRTALKIQIINHYKLSNNSFSTINGEIGFLKENEDFFDLLNEATKDNQFHIRFMDNSIITLEYKFDRKGAIIKHRLIYLKDPSIENNSILGIRCDFDPSSDSYKEVIHPKSHVTFLGGNKRIIINQSLTISDFVYLCRIFIDNNHYDNSFNLLTTRVDLRSQLEKKHVSIVFPKN